MCFQWRGKPLKGTIAKVLTWRWVNTDTEQDELDHTSSPRKRVGRVVRAKLVLCDFDWLLNVCVQSPMLCCSIRMICVGL